MEGIKHETRRQIISNFYQKNREKGKAYTIRFFEALDVKKDQVYQAISRVEAGTSHEQRRGAGRPRKLSKQQEKHVMKSMENKNPTPFFTDDFVLNLF